MTEIVLQRPDVGPVEKEIAPILSQAQGIAVRNKDEHKLALHVILDISAKERFIQDLFADSKKAAHQAHRSITALEKSLLEPLTKAKRVVAIKCDEYEEAERRRADAERRRLEDEARKKQEEDKKLDAILAAESGDDNEAEAILEQPVVVPAVKVESEAAKVEGVSTQKRYSAEVTDKMALIKYVAANPEWECMLDPNMPVLNRMAVSMRENLNVPGVRVIVKTVRAIKR
jgi:hypothetical protein